MNQTMPLGDTATRPQVPALLRASAILDLLSQCHEALSLSDISRRLNLAKSSTHALCDTLVQLDLIRQDGKSYHLGARPVLWANAFTQQSDILREFLYQIENDPLLSRYTISLSRLEGDHVSYLASHHSRQALGFTFASGLRLPSVYTATGKAMLAALSDEARQDLLPKIWPEALTQHSVRATDWPKQIEQWQAMGYAIDQEELRNGMVCVGVIIADPTGYPLGGLALSLTKQEADALDLAQLADALRAVGHKLAPFAPR